MLSASSSPTRETRIPGTRPACRPRPGGPPGRRDRNSIDSALAPACNDRAVTDQPAPTEEEHEQAPERQADEEAKQGVDPDQLDDEEE